ncbi:Uncharacterized protein TCM_002019 isoform 2, partial [Theobroma cacao]
KTLKTLFLVFAIGSRCPPRPASTSSSLHAVKAADLQKPRLLRNLQYPLLSSIYIHRNLSAFSYISYLFITQSFLLPFFPPIYIISFL